jgi:hypothetical protein
MGGLECNAAAALLAELDMDWDLRTPRQLWALLFDGQTLGAWYG